MMDKFNSSNTEGSKVKAKYYINDLLNGWHETELRPSADGLEELLKEAEERRKIAMKHRPGQGWHFVPTKELEFVFNITHYGARYWWVCWPDSTGAILAETANFCKAHNLDFSALQRQAYPDQTPYEPDSRDYADLADPDVIPDYQTMLEDLTDINYHSLHGCIVEVMRLDAD